MGKKSNGIQQLDFKYSRTCDARENLRKEKEYEDIKNFPHMQPDFYTRLVETQEVVKDENGKELEDEDGFPLTKTVKKPYKEVYTVPKSFEFFDDVRYGRRYDFDGGIALAHHFDTLPVLIDEDCNIIARLVGRDLYLTLDKKWCYYYDKDYTDDVNDLGGMLVCAVPIEDFCDLLDHEKLQNDPIRAQLNDALMDTDYIDFLVRDKVRIPPRPDKDK